MLTITGLTKGLKAEKPNKVRSGVRSFSVSCSTSRVYSCDQMLSTRSNNVRKIDKNCFQPLKLNSVWDKPTKSALVFDNLIKLIPFSVMQSMWAAMLF